MKTLSAKRKNVFGPLDLVLSGYQFICQKAALFEPVSFYLKIPEKRDTLTDTRQFSGTLNLRHTQKWLIFNHQSFIFFSTKMTIFEENHKRMSVFVK